ncbi:unnamed protein product, partial [Hapterophycus canaliculatus]
QGETPGERSTGDDGIIARKTITSPGRPSKNRRFDRARSRTGDEDEAAHISWGTNNVSPRQRPLSAPPKAYPFARHEGLSQEQDREEMDESEGLVAGARDRAYKSRRSCGDPDEVEREPVEKGRDGRGTGRCGTVRGSENSGGHQRLSMSSTFGVASERRRSDERQTSTKHSLLPNGREKVARGGATGSGLQEGGKEGGETVDAPLSSQEFGLCRWKEYAVLRHGRNRRFVNSPHGREILQETAAKLRTKEVEELNRELKEMRALVEELHSALRTEQTEKSSLQARVILLEREVEGMDFARRRWLREDASNRCRGSNLERRLAGNTGNLRTFLFGVSAKPETTRSTAPEEPSRSSASRSRSPVGPGRSFGGCGGVGGTAVSERSSAGEEEHGDGEGNAAVAERRAVQRARETAELERSELRRRHHVEMSAKQSRIDKLKLEIRKLEAERDGLKQAAESQAGLFKEGYAELRACLQEMRTHRPALLSTAYGSTIPSSEDTPTTDAEAGCPWIKRAPTNGHGTETWVKTTPATEETLNHQACPAHALQSLLLEAVSAAAPAVHMPAAVTEAADAFREGTGLPPLAPPVPHDLLHSSSSRHPGAAAARAGARRGDLEPAGNGPPRQSGGPERGCDTDKGLELSGDGEPLRQARDRHHYPTTPSAGQAVADAAPRPALESEEGTETILARNAARVRDGSSIRPTATRGIRNDDDSCRSCTGSEGSGTEWMRVSPTDETSSEEELVFPPSTKSHDGEKTRGPG